MNIVSDIEEQLVNFDKRLKEDSKKIREYESI